MFFLKIVREKDSLIGYFQILQIIKLKMYFLIKLLNYLN